MNQEKKTLVFATNNKHKLEEARGILTDEFEIISLDQLGCYDEIPETGTTLQENALIKAKWIAEKYSCTCFSDDTGLEVEALGGRPGVYSARYAGEKCSFEDNIRKLLTEMEGETNRKACFRTVVAYIDRKETKFFEGSIEGTILEKREGEKGFGYDPVFRPDGYKKTFAQLTDKEKNAVSHRGKALRALSQWLSSKEG